MDKNELKKYDTSKGAIRFPLDVPGRTSIAVCGRLVAALFLAGSK